MAFDPVATQIPTSIGDIRVILQEYVNSPTPENPTTTYTRRATAEIQVLDQNGVLLKVWSGDIVPHITAEQIAWLVQFIIDVRAKADAELLPTT